MRLKSYLFPSAIAALVLAASFVAGEFAGARQLVRYPEPLKPQPVSESPHGRILHVVVDQDGIYIGDRLVFFDDFHDYLIGYAREMHPDSAVVCGTRSSRFGRVAEALGTIRAVLNITATMETRTFADGTRQEAVEVREP